MYLQGITPLRIPRKFHWGNLAPKGRLALVAVRILILVNTALISVVAGALGFWVLGLSENVVPGWPPPTAYWIVFAIAFGSVPLLVVYTLVRDLKAQKDSSRPQRIREVFLDELGVVPERTLKDKTKRLATLQQLGLTAGIVFGVFFPGIGMALVTLAYGIPRLLFILWSRPYVSDNGERNRAEG